MGVPSAKLDSNCVNHKKNPNGQFGLVSVELVGFEPTSKQAAKMLSTCLAFSWGFGNEPGKGDPIPYLSP